MNRQQRRAAARQAKKTPAGGTATAAAQHAMTPETAALLERAVSLHGDGRLGEAQDCYQQVLADDPEQADALHFLGVLNHQAGRSEVAIELIGRSVERCPKSAVFASNYGKVLQDCGQLDAALEHYRTATRLDPEQPEPHNNLGAILLRQGCLDDAGTALNRALELKPDYAEAHGNLASVLVQRGRLADGFEACREALRLNPELADPYNVLGTALKISGRPVEAETAFREAIRLNPSLAEAHNNLGAALMDLNKLEAAARACLTASGLREGFANAQSNLGLVFMTQGKVSEASTAYRAAHELEPENPIFRSNLLFVLNYDPDISPDGLLDESRRLAPAASAPPRSSSSRRSASAPLRIGYVSPDFRTHSVASFVEPLLQAHDRAAVEVFCYAEVAQPDGTTERLKNAADAWRSTVGQTTAQVTEMIAADGIDILVDLAGHTAGNRLPVFAHKPAPVQVTWLGYPGTTGMPAIGHRVTDAVADPAGESDAGYVERLVRLPHGFLCYGPPAEAPAVAASPCVGKGYVTFGSFNALAKLNAHVIDAWARILERVDGARLIVKGRAFADDGARRRYRSLFEKAGVDPDRIDLVSWIDSRGGHLGAYEHVDIALDPFPYNGTTTTCEAMHMGVPVVSCRGDRHAARVGATLLGAVGLDDLVAETQDAYIELATDLAADRARLENLRGSLRQTMAASPLCDADRFARDMETAYRQIWQRHLDGG